MFERYSEKARRVVFFARYEASQYGSSTIDTEHMLLGLLRENHAMCHRLIGPIDLERQIRTEVGKTMKRGKVFSTSVEVPLSADSKKLLTFATEEADRLGHKFIETEHILLAILHFEGSLAARLLVARGANLGAIREKIAGGSFPVAPDAEPHKGALIALDGFLGVLKDGSACPADFFDADGQFVDSSGKNWIGRTEIEIGAEILFAPFAKKNAKFSLQKTVHGPSDTVVASVLWEFGAASTGHSKAALRMSIVLACAGDDWLIVLAQVTPCLQSSSTTA